MAPPASTEDAIFVMDNLPSSLMTESPQQDRNANTNGDNGSNNGAANEDDVDDDSFYAPSVDTTHLASSVGSVVGPTRTAFLRSITFLRDEPDDLRWDITFTDDVVDENGNVISSSRKKKSSFLPSFRNKNKAVTVASISGHMTLSKIQVGDVVTKINSKRIGLSYNAERVSQCLSQAANKNDMLSIQTGNENGADTIIQVTIIKPRPDMTAKELGLGVWWWRGLCMRFLTPGTLASMTPLRVDDELESVNDIILEDYVKPEGFERIVRELPCEITLVVRRGKARWNGHFG